MSPDTGSLSGPPCLQRSKSVLQRSAAAGMAGQIEVAMAALQELRRAQPNISLAWIANQVPIKQDADREHYLEGFRRAGLG